MEAHTSHERPSRGQGLTEIECDCAHRCFQTHDRCVFVKKDFRKSWEKLSRWAPEKESQKQHKSDLSTLWRTN
jgi:hypothetical protein